MHRGTAIGFDYELDGQIDDLRVFITVPFHPRKYLVFICVLVKGKWITMTITVFFIGVVKITHHTKSLTLLVVEGADAQQVVRLSQVQKGQCNMIPPIIKWCFVAEQIG